MTYRCADSITSASRRKVFESSPRILLTSDIVSCPFSDTSSAGSPARAVVLKLVFDDGVETRIEDIAGRLGAERVSRSPCELSRVVIVDQVGERKTLGNSKLWDEAVCGLLGTVEGMSGVGVKFEWLEEGEREESGDIHVKASKWGGNCGRLRLLLW